MLDSKACVLNGRSDKNFDNFTFVSALGKSVVDYMTMFHTQFIEISSFQTLLVSDCIKKFNILVDTATILDHSIITGTLNVSKYPN